VVLFVNHATRDGNESYDPKIDVILDPDTSPAEAKAVGLLAAGRTRADLRLSSLAAWHVKAAAEASRAEARSQLALRGMLEDWYIDSFMDPDEYRLVQAHIARLRRFRDLGLIGERVVPALAA